ncbi:MAG: DNA repair exonuclease [Desulfobacterales bacterium]
MLTFLHAADIHLDSPLRGLSHYDGAPPIEEIRGATRQALDNLVNFALGEKVDFVLIAGDLYDGDWQDFKTGLYFANQMRNLGEAGIRVAVIRGNHDAANTMTKTLVMPENVKIFSARKPETWLLKDFGVAIHGQSYANRDVYENLAVTYPDPVPGMFNIGILHCLISGADGHLPYAPCTLDELAAKGYDYWALGHVHNYSVLREQPHIVYSGCTQGRHIREPGEKGCVLVEVEDDKIRTEFVPLNVLRWAEIKADVGNTQNIEQAAIAFGEALSREMSDLNGMNACVRAVLTGRCPAHGRLSLDPEAVVANIRAIASEVSEGKVWIEKVQVQTRPAIDFDSIAQSDTPQGELMRYLKELIGNPKAIEELGLDLTALKSKLAGSGVKVNEDEINELLSDAGDILLTMLEDEEGLQS